MIEIVLLMAQASHRTEFQPVSPPPGISELGGGVDSVGVSVVCAKDGGNARETNT